MSIELINYSPTEDDKKMTQVEPVQPVKPEKVDVVLPKGASDPSEFSHISLHQAARDGRSDVINHKLFKLGRAASSRRLKVINKLDEDSISALHYAVRYGHLDVVKLLVENGADINVEGLDGATPLHYAARFHAISSKIRHQSVIDATSGDMLDQLDTGNELVPRRSISDDAVSLSGDDGDSIIDYLLSLDCDINNRDSYGQTPLHYAANKSNVAAAKKLLHHSDIRVDQH